MRVCAFESRRAADMRSLIERQGGEPTVVPSMREVPLADNAAAFAFAEDLFAAKIDLVIFLTGVGARTLLEAVQTRHNREQFLRALDRVTIAVRGPKPLAVLREWNVHVDLRAPEPNTWRELLAELDRHSPVIGRHVAVQEYGKPNDNFYRELEHRGALVLRVPVYQWALPEDIAPLEDAVRSIVAGRFDLLLFTSAQQAHNVVEVAESLGLRDAWLSAAARVVVASIGPTASETLRELGLPVDVEASPPKMGQLVRDALSAAAEILARKSAGHQNRRIAD